MLSLKFIYLILILLIFSTYFTKLLVIFDYSILGKGFLLYIIKIYKLLNQIEISLSNILGFITSIPLFFILILTIKISIFIIVIILIYFILVINLFR